MFLMNKDVCHPVQSLQLAFQRAIHSHKIEGMAACVWDSLFRNERRRAFEHRLSGRSIRSGHSAPVKCSGLRDVARNPYSSHRKRRYGEGLWLLPPEAAPSLWSKAAPGREGPCRCRLQCQMRSKTVEHLVPFRGEESRVRWSIADGSPECQYPCHGRDPALPLSQMDAPITELRDAARTRWKCRL